MPGMKPINTLVRISKESRASVLHDEASTPRDQNSKNPLKAHEKVGG